MNGCKKIIKTSSIKFKDNYIFYLNTLNLLMIKPCANLHL